MASLTDDAMDDEYDERDDLDVEVPLEEEEDDDDDDDRMELSINIQPPPPLRTSIVRPETFEHLPTSLLECRELGDEATWTLSSAKPGNGAEALRNGDTSTYWQSDGNNPHTITVQFHRRVALSALAIYCAFSLDESYTPKRIKVVSGMTTRDLEHVVEVELDNPKGWAVIGLTDPTTKRPLKTFTLQIRCIAMHHNGRDTHVRAVKLFGPRSTDMNARSSLASPSAEIAPTTAPTSQALAVFSMIR